MLKDPKYTERADASKAAEARFAELVNDFLKQITDKMSDGELLDWIENACRDKDLHVPPYITRRLLPLARKGYEASK